VIGACPSCSSGKRLFICTSTSLLTVVGADKNRPDATMRGDANGSNKICGVQKWPCDGVQASRIACAAAKEHRFIPVILSARDLGEKITHMIHSAGNFSSWQPSEIQNTLDSYGKFIATCLRFSFTLRHHKHQSINNFLNESLRCVSSRLYPRLGHITVTKVFEREQYHSSTQDRTEDRR
jgi:hypothetical protein